MSGQTYDSPVAATKPVTPLPSLRAYSSRLAASGVIPSVKSGISRLVDAIEQPDLDEVEPQQVLHVAGDVVLEQVGSLFDGHLGELFGRQVGELVARLVDGVDLELLLRLVGRLAGQCDQVRQCVRSRRRPE